MAFINILLILLLKFVLGLSIAADDVSFVVVGLEPGSCNPTNYLQTDEKNGAWAPEGKNQLNNFGKEQSLVFGKYIRERYRELLSRDFHNDEFLGITCSEQKCQRTLLSLYAGLYSPSPKDKFNSQLSWQPIPLSLEDGALGVSRISCRYYQTLKQNYLDSSSSDRGNSNLTDLSIYLGKNAGINATVQGLVDVIENWKTMRTDFISPPTYLVNPTLQGYNSETLYQKLITVEQSSKQVCSNDSNCRKTAAGFWLHKLLQVIDDKSNRNSTLKMLVNVAETDNMMSLLKLLKVGNFTSSFTSGFFLEFRSYPTPGLRLILHSLFNETNNIKQFDRRLVYQNLSFCNYVEWCPIDTFLKELDAEATPSHSCNSSTGTKSILSSLVILIFALIIFH